MKHRQSPFLTRRIRLSNQSARSSNPTSLSINPTSRSTNPGSRSIINASRSTTPLSRSTTPPSRLTNSLPRAKTIRQSDGQMTNNQSAIDRRTSNHGRMNDHTEVDRLASNHRGASEIAEQKSKKQKRRDSRGKKESWFSWIAPSIALLFLQVNPFFFFFLCKSFISFIFSMLLGGKQVATKSETNERNDMKKSIS